MLGYTLHSNPHYIIYSLTHFGKINISTLEKYYKSLTFKLPPVDGLSPKIQTRCCSVVRRRCQAAPKTPPWQWAIESVALMHCRFLLVSITGPCCAPTGKDGVARAVPTATTWCRTCKEYCYCKSLPLCIV